VFKPRWKKDALHLLKGSKKFLHYKRDLLKEDRIDEIESRRADLKAAIKAKDLEAVKETSKQVRNTCEKSLAHYKQPDWLQENIEVFWVAIVVALGIRAYFLQPFRIPTGSMQPSLNGIVATSKHGEEGWEKPWFGQRAFDFLIQGKTYENLVAEKDLTIKRFEDATFFLFSRTKVHFDDGSSIVIGCPENEVFGIETIKDKFVQQGNKTVLKPGPHFKKGDPIFQGYLTSGDLVLVDKISYHFRQPKRGESFVFDTRDLMRKKNSPQRMSDQNSGSHYIKRLAGLPGDTLQIEAPNLYINGSLAKEETLKRVMAMGKDSKGEPYRGYYNNGNFSNPSHTVTLEDNPKEGNNYREFYALGDNSRDSSDSRYWGSVKQYNLVGPALFSLWPFTSGHWGIIE
jgi:signal peptidase I